MTHPRTGNCLAMNSQTETKIDSKVDISRYGAGLQLVPTARTARLIEESGVLVATGDATIDDDVVFALIDAGRP